MMTPSSALLYSWQADFPPPLKDGEDAPIRVLLVDSHPIFRYGMRALLETTPDLLVVGETASGAMGVRAAAELAPDVVLMDLHLSDISGIEATAHIRQAHPHIAVLIVALLEDDAIFAAMRAGAKGYLRKDAEPPETLRAIYAVANGEAIFSPRVADRFMIYFSQSHADVPPHHAAAFPMLTARERQVLALVAQGLTNKAIAERLVLSPKTVRNYISEIFSKLHVPDRGHAILLARDCNLS